MDEKENLGMDIINEILFNTSEEKKEKILKKINEDRKLDALSVGFDYNTYKIENIPQCEVDVVFGEGYLLAIKHIEDYLKKT